MDYSFLTSDMVLSDNLVPAKYAGQDVRLLYSKENPAYLGYWLNTPHGHQRIGLKDMVEYISGKPYKINDPDNKEVADLIKMLPNAYHKESSL